jgi:hypothetical protein
MQPSEVMSFIQAYKPEGDKGDIFEDPKTLKFEELVSKDPAGYSKLSPYLMNAHPIFFYRFFNALGELINREQVAIDWSNLILFCQNYLLLRT